MTFLVIPDSELEEGRVSHQEHFRRINNNAAEFQLLPRQVIAMRPQEPIPAEWVEHFDANGQREVRNEVVGTRKCGFLNLSRCPRHADVTYYRWRALYNALYTVRIPLPTTYHIIGFQLQGNITSNAATDSRWSLIDWGIGRDGENILAYATAKFFDGNFQGGNGRREGRNTPPILPENYPGGEVTPSEPSEAAPTFTISIRPIGIRGGNLPIIDDIFVQPPVEPGDYVEVAKWNVGASATNTNAEYSGTGNNIIFTTAKSGSIPNDASGVFRLSIVGNSNVEDRHIEGYYNSAPSGSLAGFRISSLPSTLSSSDPAGNMRFIFGNSNINTGGGEWVLSKRQV